jgi:O-antigen ligase
MTAEFIALSTLLNGYFFFDQFSKKNHLKNTALISTILFGFIYLFLLSTRGPLLALALSIFILISFTFIKSRKKNLILITSMIFLAGALFLKPFQSQNKNWLENAKISNTKIRLIRWTNTLAMIKDHPMGVGPGNFEFGYLPYANAVTEDYEFTEDVLPRSPHNAYLELIVEAGIPAALTIFSVLIFLLIRLFKKPVSLERNFYISIFSFFIIDAFFAFPLETAYPFYFAAVFLALIVHFIFFENNKNHLKTLSLPKTYLFYALAFIIITPLSWCI